MALIEDFNGSSSIMGTDEDDEIAGYYGNDVIYGAGGNDFIGGGWGNDILYGNVGDDYLDGGEEDDEIHGGEGNDQLANIMGGKDLFYGEDGNDLLQGDEENPLVLGGAGNDTIVMSGGTAYGDEGNDYLGVALAGETSKQGTLYGGDGNDLVIGDNFNDLLYGEVGDDILIGEAGDDILRGGSGNDTIEGDASPTSSFYYPLDADDTGNDLIYGEDGNDFLVGEKGDDTIWGGSGNDILHGALANFNPEKILPVGSEYLPGKWAHFDHPEQIVPIDFEDKNELHGDEGNDILIGGTGEDKLVGCGDQLGVGEIDELTGQTGKDTFVLGDKGEAFYNDGNEEEISTLAAQKFGLKTMTSAPGWRVIPGLEKYNRFHLGVDYNWKSGVKHEFKAGVNGNVISARVGKIVVRLSTGNTIEYLHGKPTKQLLKNLEKGQTVVKPEDVIGITDKINASQIHLHVQARNPQGRLIDVSSAIRGQTREPATWCQGLGDYALIKDFQHDDILQLVGSSQRYKLLQISETQDIVREGLIPRGIAIIYDSDGMGFSKASLRRDELVGLIEGINWLPGSNQFQYV